MQATFEHTINEVLKEQSQIDLAIDKLLRIWKDRGCSREDTLSLFRFLLHCGYELTLVSQLQFLLDKKLPIPWLYILEIYYRNKSHLQIAQSEFINLLFVAADEKSLHEIIKFYKFDAIDRRFDVLRSEWISKELEEKHSRKKAILNKLQMLKHERMLEEERKLFIQALEEFPTDDELLHKYTDFQKRYADNVFQKSETKKDSLWQKFLRKEENSQKTPYITSMLELAQKFPNETYWIASSLFLAECYEACIQLLENKEASSEEKWLLLEAYIQEQKYLLALEYARQLEEEYKDHPEQLMAALYHQAICLEKLGKRAEALQILKSILSYNKNFKMAQYLYDQWMKS